MAQDRYVRLPDGRYVHIPPDATPEQLAQLRQKLSKFLPRPTEAQQAKEAQESYLKYLEDTSYPFGTREAARAQGRDQPPKAAAKPGMVARYERSLRGGMGLPPEGTFTSDIKDLGQGIKEMVSHPLYSGELVGSSAVKAQQDLINKAYMEQHSPDWTTKLHGYIRGMYASIPMLGPVLNQAGEELEDWNIAGAAGTMTPVVASEGMRSPVGARVIETLTDSQKLAAALSRGEPSKIPIQVGAQQLADALSKENLSPAQYANRLRSGAAVPNQLGFDTLSDEAGAAKGSVVSRIASQAPDTQVRFLNTLQTLRTAVENLQQMKKMNPALFKEGEAYANTLDILQQELQSVQQEAHAARLAQSQFGQQIGMPKPLTNIISADSRRSNFWKFRESIKPPSYARKLVGDLNESLTKDIRAAVAEHDPALADEYVTTSNRYAQIQSIAREEGFKQIFGNKRMPADKVVSVLYKYPEESVRAIRALYRENPAALKLLRRQLFEYGMQGVPPGSRAPQLGRMPPSVLREVFGPQAHAVKMFIDAASPVAQPANPLLQIVMDKFGLKKYYLNDPAGKVPVQISTEEMGKILDSAHGLTTAAKALRMSTTSPPARYYHSMLIRILPALGIFGEAQEAQ